MSEDRGEVGCPNLDPGEGDRIQGFKPGVRGIICAGNNLKYAGSKMPRPGDQPAKGITMAGGMNVRPLKQYQFRPLDVLCIALYGLWIADM